MNANVNKATVTEDGSALHAAYASVAEITINAPASTVWPLVLDMGSWVQDFHFEHASGEINSEGEIRYLWPMEIKVLGGIKRIAAKDRTVRTAAAYKTLKIIPERLWYAVCLPKMESSQKAFAVPDATEAGEADVRSAGAFLVSLHEANGQTLVTTLRIQESHCPTAQAAVGVQESMMQYQPMAQTRWTSQYLPRLKALAEQIDS
jgi:hypothetical protein